MTRWTGCYSDSWQDLIVPDAYQHPVKFSRALIHHIYRHLLEQRYVRKGDTIVDPFGGVALGALDALTYGLTWIGCELEEKFVVLGNANLDKWQQEYGFTGAQIIQGDSRQLRQVLAGTGVQGCVGSPPFAQSDGRKGGSDLYLETRRQTGRNPSSPSAGYGAIEPYGTTPGQLGALPPGSLETVLEGVQGVLGSPPYEGIAIRRDREQEANWHTEQHYRQGKTQGQHSAHQYGATANQLGNSTGDTFWSAAAQILIECWHLLPPGAPCVWVLKDYIKAGKRVPFCRQWEALCHAQGFVTAEWIEASLVEVHGTQETLFDGPHEVRTERMSFFRRLHVKKRPDLAINEEMVLITKRGT